MNYILNDAGEPEPCDDLLHWAAWFETADRRVAQDMDEGDGPNGVRVSTVFLGLDHNVTGHGPPVLWETLVFNGPMNGYMERYSSAAAARIGHQRICELVQAAI
jgi:hypothetical protein